MEWILWWQLYNFSNNAGTNEGLSNAFSAGQGLLNELISILPIALLISVPIIILIKCLEKNAE